MDAQNSTAARPKASKPKSRNLDDAFVRSLQKRHAARVDLGDTRCPGLQVRASTKGAVTFVWKAPVGSTVDPETGVEGRRLVLLGHFPALLVGAARAKLDEARAEWKQGLSEGGTAAARRRLDEFLRPTEGVLTVAQVVKEFSEKYLDATSKRPKPRKQLLDRFVAPPPFGNLLITEVNHRRCAAVIEDAAKPTAPGKRPRGPQAMNLSRVMKRLFSYAISKGYIEVSPMAALKATDLGARNATPRKRTLSPQEIGEVWRVLSAPCRLDARLGRLALRVLMLLPARQGELVLAKWRHIDLKARTWKIPPESRKMTKENAETAEPLVLPLSDEAVEVFLLLEKLTSHSEWVLASPKKGATGHVSETALARHAFELFTENGERAALLTMPRWTPHDLRRTFRTHARVTLRIPYDVAEKAVGHKVGSIIDQTYMTSDLSDEVRDALARWSKYVLERAAILPGTEEVIDLAAKRVAR